MHITCRLSNHHLIHTSREDLLPLLLPLSCPAHHADIPPCHTRLGASHFRYNQDWQHIPAHVDFCVLIGYRGKSITFLLCRGSCTTQTSLLEQLEKMLLITQSHLLLSLNEMLRTFRRILQFGIVSSSKVLSKRPLSLRAVSCFWGNGRLDP